MDRILADYLAHPQQCWINPFATKTVDVGIALVAVSRTIDFVLLALVADVPKRLPRSWRGIYLPHRRQVQLLGRNA